MHRRSQQGNEHQVGAWVSENRRFCTGQQHPQTRSNRWEQGCHPYPCGHRWVQETETAAPGGDWEDGCGLFHRVVIPSSWMSGATSRTTVYGNENPRSAGATGPDTDWIPIRMTWFLWGRKDGRPSKFATTCGNSMELVATWEWSPTGCGKPGSKYTILRSPFCWWWWPSPSDEPGWRILRGSWTKRQNCLLPSSTCNSRFQVRVRCDGSSWSWTPWTFPLCCVTLQRVTTWILS